MSKSNARHLADENGEPPVSKPAGHGYHPRHGSTGTAPEPSAAQDTRSTNGPETSATSETSDTSGASATGAPNADSTAEKGETSGRKPPLIAFVLGLPVLFCLLLLAFVSPTIHSGAKDLPLAVSGPPQAVKTVSAQLQHAKPGAFDVHTYATPAQAADAIKNRTDIGGISVGKQGVTIQTAAGAGTPYTQVLKGVGAGLQSKGQKVTYSELAPLPAKDPMGTVLTSAGLPLIIGGMATAATLFFAFRGSFGRRCLGILGASTLGGLLAALVLRSWMHAVDCSYGMLALAFGVGIAAISFTVIGLAKNLGPAGFGLGALLMLFISNPISGLATGPQWLPHPWGTIGQFLPVGAAGTVLRSVAYFDGSGATRAWIVLICWAVGGFVLLSLGKVRKTAH